MNILIIDDHRLFADGLKLVINDLQGAQSYTVDQAYSAQRALDFVNAGKHYDLILTDLDMPGIDGHELVQSLVSRRVGSYIAVVSASNALSDIKKAYQQGARGYICKSESSIEMQTKLKALTEGKTSFPNEVWETLKNEPDHADDNINTISGLGKRPLQVLKLLASGKSNKQIASVLNISETTVKFHVRTLFNTLKVNNRTWCVREAHRRGFIETVEEV